MLRVCVLKVLGDHWCKLYLSSLLWKLDRASRVWTGIQTRIKCLLFYRWSASCNYWSRRWAYEVCFCRILHIYYLMIHFVQSDGDYILHPAILDASFHTSLFKQFTGDHDKNSYYLPSGVRSVILHKNPKVHLFTSLVFAHCVFAKWTKGAWIVVSVGRNLRIIRYCCIWHHFDWRQRYPALYIGVLRSY